MKCIITLQGKADSGKTSTINVLDEILRDHGFVPQPGLCIAGRSDIAFVYEYDGLRVGIFSHCESYAIMQEKLQYMDRHGCEVVVCTCRTFDKNEKGTNAAIDEAEADEKSFIQKSVAFQTFHMSKMNELDARILFAKVRNTVEDILKTR